MTYEQTAITVLTSEKINIADIMGEDFNLELPLPLLPEQIEGGPEMEYQHVSKEDLLNSNKIKDYLEKSKYVNQNNDQANLCSQDIT